MRVESRIRPKGTITLRGKSYPSGEVSIDPGINSYTAEIWGLMQDDAVVQYHLERQNLVVRTDIEQPQPTPQPESGGDQSLAGVSYVPLTPTTEQLLPIDGIGPVKATTIINNTPEGGYTSPTQLIDINSLSLDESLIEVLFEIA